ncbi:MAG: HAD-IA family hydrolase [Planctomycetota bacterium]|nr:HAD-IA family hydrolase [Planctomycetota bacterium]
MRYRTFLFDLDGTLVDSLQDIASGVNAARAGLGLEPLATETVRGFVGDGVTKLIERAVPEAALRARAAELFRAYYGAHLTDATRPYDGIVEVLEAIRAHGGRAAVVTNKPHAFAVPILEGLGLAGYFGAVLGGDSTPEKKPSPQPFQVALEQLGRPRDGSGETLVVGDGRNDILGAKAAGLPSCAVCWGFGSEDELRALGADYAARRPSELLERVAAR